MSQQFRAVWVEEQPDGSFHRSIAERNVADLPPGELLIRVAYSSLNYKDALSAAGNRGVTRKYPHTPGIDAAGVVAESASPAFRPGDEVIVIGYDLGMNTPGGFGEYIRVPAGWAVPRPAGLSLWESMALGTAGFTAAQSVQALVGHGVQPGSGEVLVTGATGGVGSVAVALLAQLGYSVTAATGKAEEADYLRGLGASLVIRGRRSTTLLADRCCASVGRRGRHGGRQHPGHGAQEHAPGRQRGGVRERGVAEPGVDGLSLHPARGEPAGYRLGQRAHRGAGCAVGTAGH